MKDWLLTDEQIAYMLEEPSESEYRGAGVTVNTIDVHHLLEAQINKDLSKVVKLLKRLSKEQWDYKAKNMSDYCNQMGKLVAYETVIKELEGVIKDG